MDGGSERGRTERRGYALLELILGAAVVAAFALGIYQLFGRTSGDASFVDLVREEGEVAAQAAKAFVTQPTYAGMSEAQVAPRLQGSWIGPTAAGGVIRTAYRQPVTVRAYPDDTQAYGYAVTTPVMPDVCGRLVVQAMGQNLTGVQVGSNPQLPAPLASGDLATLRTQCATSGTMVPVSFVYADKPGAVAQLVNLPTIVTPPLSRTTVTGTAGPSSATGGQTSSAGGSGNPGTGTGQGTVGSAPAAGGAASSGSSTTAGGTTTDPSAGTSAGQIPATGTSGAGTGSGTQASGGAGQGATTFPPNGDGTTTGTSSGVNQVPACTPAIDQVDAAANVGSDGQTLQFGNAGSTFKVTGAGSDRLVFCAGEGNKDIYDAGGPYDRDDDLVLAGLSPSDVTFTRVNGNELDVKVNATGEVVKVDYQFYDQDGGRYGLGSVTFGDGTTWDRTQIHDAAWIRGGLVSNTIGIPNDATPVTVDTPVGINQYRVQGNGGAIFRWGSTYGNEDLYQSGYYYNRTDVLDLLDMKQSDVVLSATPNSFGESLVITSIATGATFTSTYQFDTQDQTGGPWNYGLTGITFSDGTTLDASGIRAAAWLRGGPTNSLIVAPPLGVTIDPGTGTHTIQASGDGGNVIRFGAGDGDTTLYNPGAGYVRTDELLLTSASESSVSLTRNGNALTVTLPGGETFLASYQFYGSGAEQGLGSIVFPDGKTWDRSAILAHVAAPVVSAM